VDSVPIREWYECLHKAAPIVTAAGSRLAPELLDEPDPPADRRTAAGVFESILVVDGVPRRLADHLSRLDRSTRELYGDGLPADLDARLQAAVAATPRARRTALRVVARPGADRSDIEVSARPLGSRLTSCSLAYATRSSRGWRHKWADRSDLDAAEAAVAPALPWFAASDGTLAETSRGNLFLLGADGRWRTPPLDEQVLPGVTRRAVLDLAGSLGLDIEIARCRPEQVRAAFWTSSLSLAVAVTALDGRPLDDVSSLTARISASLGA
jgi:para-aminobenzoate synthetase/4-amino-4-deoxychorismate lyase